MWSRGLGEHCPLGRIYGPTKPRDFVNKMTGTLRSSRIFVGTPGKLLRLAEMVRLCAVHASSSVCSTRSHLTTHTHTHTHTLAPARGCALSTMRLSTLPIPIPVHSTACPRLPPMALVMHARAHREHTMRTICGWLWRTCSSTPKHATSARCRKHASTFWVSSWARFGLKRVTATSRLLFSDAFWRVDTRELSARACRSTCACVQSLAKLHVDSCTSTHAPASFRVRAWVQNARFFRLRVSLEYIMR